MSVDEAVKLAVETDMDTSEVKNWFTGFGTREHVINNKGIEILQKVKYEILKSYFSEILKEV